MPDMGESIPAFNDGRAGIPH
eukprot:COSAG01_NODE_54661_length_330_cov_1.696970_1_plen_20_part_01